MIVSFAGDSIMRDGQTTISQDDNMQDDKLGSFTLRTFQSSMDKK